MKNSGRYISVWRLVAVLSKKFRARGTIHYDDLMATIADIPTEKAVIEQGKWESHPHHPGLVRCSKCKEFIRNESAAVEEPWRFCPLCGTELRCSDEIGID